jgi:hypothetical protein
MLISHLQLVRYILSVHSIGGPSGTAEPKGNDAIIALGDGFHSTAGAAEGHTGSTGTRIQQGGTLMHELGHLLNLRHGGPYYFDADGDGVFSNTEKAATNSEADINCKPNYVSVMSYSRQLKSYLGNAGYHLDYSHGVLPQIDETSGIPEATGLKHSSDPLGSAFTWTVTWASALLGVQTGTTTLSTAPAGTETPLDWDGNGADTIPAPTGAAADVNNFGIRGCQVSVNDPAYSDFNDWAHLDFNFKDTVHGQIDGGGANVSPSPTEENDNSNQNAMNVVTTEASDMLQPFSNNHLSKSCGPNIPLKLSFEFLADEGTEDEEVVLIQEANVRAWAILDGGDGTHIPITENDGHELLHLDNGQHWHIDWDNSALCTDDGTVDRYGILVTIDSPLTIGPEFLPKPNDGVVVFDINNNEIPVTGIIDLQN